MSRAQTASGAPQTHAAAAPESEAEHGLTGAFRSAANSVALFYKEALAQNRRSFESGYMQCLNDLAAYMSMRLQSSRSGAHSAELLDDAAFSLADLAAFVETRRAQLHFQDQQQTPPSTTQTLQSAHMLGTRQQQTSASELAHASSSSAARSHSSSSLSNRRSSAASRSQTDDDSVGRLSLSRSLQLGELLENLPGIAPTAQAHAPLQSNADAPSATQPAAAVSSLSSPTSMSSPSVHASAPVHEKSAEALNLQPSESAMAPSALGLISTPSATLKRSRIGELTPHEFFDAITRPGQTSNMVIEPPVFGAHAGAEHTTKRIRFAMTD